MDFEAKLAEYRASKHKQYLDENERRKPKPPSGFFGFLFGRMDAEPLIEHHQNGIDIGGGGGDSVDAENLSLFSNTRRTYAYFGGFCVWLVAFLAFVQYQWGAVFFVVSALLFVYFNTRTGPKRAGEVSAYSVFNKDCKTIDGTLTAEQFEKELRFGPGTV